jgi:putative endonuclease
MMEESQGSNHPICSSSTDESKEIESRWIVYLALCSDGSIYTGITTDLERREHEHNHTKRGAKYTRSRRPVELYEISRHENRSLASKEEAKIKKMNQKNLLIF